MNGERMAAVHRSSFIVHRSENHMAETKTIFEKLKRGLFMTHTEIIEKVKESMTPDLPISQSAIDSLEEGLLGADVGAELTMSLVERIEGRVRNEKISKMDRFT